MKTDDMAKKSEYDVLLPGYLIKFKIVIVGTPKLKLHDPDCKMGFFFQVWITNERWSHRPSGPRTTFYENVSIKKNRLIANVKIMSKNGDCIGTKDVPLECKNAKESIKSMKASISQWCENA